MAKTFCVDGKMMIKCFVLFISIISFFCELRLLSNDETVRIFMGTIK